MMMRQRKFPGRFGLVVSLLCLAAPSPAPGGIGTWKSYTSMHEVRDHVRAGDWYWAATGGGLFAWQGETDEFQTFTNAEGLLSNNLTATAVDFRGNIWSGASNGVIQVLLPGESWSYILDITESSQTNKQINQFVMQNDTVLICTNFGLSLFDADAFVFGDTYTKFGSLANVRVAVSDAVVFSDSIWITVSDEVSTHRIAVAALSNPNRLPPEAWSLRVVGDLSVRPVSLEVFNNQLYVGTTQGVYLLLEDAWVPVPGLEGVNVVDMEATASSLFVCSATGVFSLSSAGVVTTFPLLPSTATSVTASTTGNPVIATTTGLLSLDGEWTNHVPDGPASNQFMSVAVDPQGRIWAATGFNGSGKGIFRFDGQHWKTFTVATDGLPSNDFYRVSVGHNGSVWASSWGKGVVEFPDGTDTVDAARIYGSNVGMEGLAANPEFIVVSDVVSDQLGNEWMSVNQAGNGEILVVRQADGVTWTTSPLKLGGASIGTLWDNVPLDHFFAVDAFGNLWGGSRDPVHNGVFTLHNRGLVEDSISVFLNEQSGLPSNDVTTVVVDRDNDIWVGTEKGIAIILDPNDPAKSGGIAAYVPLNGLVVNTIAVDALNQKWVGTPDGVILLSPDGIQQLASYSVETSGGKLIDNDVRSIAIDNKTGTVYFGTLVGLSSLTTVAADPKNDFETLTISPNPFLLPAGSPGLLIDGLVENSVIKILRIDGSLVREMNSPGGRVGFWDGQDMDGQDVASGIYLVVAYSADGSKVSTAKVAVVRR